MTVNLQTNKLDSSSRDIIGLEFVIKGTTLFDISPRLEGFGSNLDVMEPL